MSGYGDGSPSTKDTGFKSGDGKSPGQVPSGTQVRHPDGKTGTSDGYGGVHTDRGNSGRK